MNDMTLAVTKSSPLEANRRDMLRGAAGLVICFTLGLPTRRAAAVGVGTAQIGSFIQISPDNTINVLVPSTEMGQGIMSGLAQIAAEELMVDWTSVTASHAPSNPIYGNPIFGIQLTAGSTSMMGWFNPLRVAAATAREMLITAGAAYLNAPRSSCSAQSGMVVVNGSGRSVPYGQIAAAAAQVPPPSDPPLVSSFRLIGTSAPRVDIPLKVDGSATYGIDVRVPGMVYAAVKHCPTLGGSVSRLPRKPRGALKLVNLGNAVAVVANSTYSAMQLAKELNVSWKIPPTSAQLDSTIIQSQAQQLMASAAAQIAETAGDPDGALAQAAASIDATYGLPYLAHACMEPLNCTVSITTGACEIWAPTQSPFDAMNSATSLTGLTPDKITIHTTFMGGGLGRKFEQDYVKQAIQVAQAVKKPVKLTWPREQDFANDQYRPMALIRVRAGVNDIGQVTSWIYRHVSPSILGQRGYPGLDTQATEGSDKLPYGFGTKRVEYIPHPAGVPVGFWRSVGFSMNTFAVECAIDELALATGQDPLALRQKLLAGNARALAVLNAAAALGNWSQQPQAGRARGIAYAEPMGSLVAQVAEISAPRANTITVHSVACVIDCGMAVNPNQIDAQMQSGILQGLGALLWSNMTFKAGKVSPTNFNRYRVPRMSEQPQIAVQIINSGAPMGGVGEPGLPPIAPAVANAYARLTGQRLRTLPFFPSQSTMGDG